MSDLIITLDTETGGFYSDYKEQDEIPRGPCALLSLGAVAYDYKHDVVINCVDLMINPDIENLLVEPQALKVNKLTLEKLKAEGMPEIDAIKQFHNFLAVSRGFYSAIPLMIPMGHNLPFDLGFLRAAYSRVNELDKLIYYPFYNTHRSIDTYTSAAYLNIGTLALEKSIKFIYSTFTEIANVEYHLLNPQDHPEYKEIIINKFIAPAEVQHHSAFVDACFTIALFRYIRSWLPPEISNRVLP